MSAIDSGLTQRVDAILAELDRAWCENEYRPAPGSEEAFAIAIRYCHLHFNTFVRLDLRPPGLAWFAPRLEEVKHALAVLDRAWIGEKFIGHYETARMADRDVRALHDALTQMKAETIKRGGWPS